MKIFVSAAEISSDLQAEKILMQLISLFPSGSVQIAGIGGPKIRALPGFQTTEPAENLRTMGFTEVAKRIFTIRKILAQTLQFLKSYQPDLILTFDYPDFHFALLKACAKIPELGSAYKVCGIPPKVWVWRAKRIHTIRALYDAVWVLFPFEKKLYEDAGIPVFYAGNPLIAEVVSHALGEKPAWNLAQEVRLAVMPGSREAEVKEHLAVIPQTLHRLSEKLGKKIVAEIPVPDGVSIERISRGLSNTERVSYLFFSNENSLNASADVLARNSVGLIKSGTSTLESAVLGCVPVIFYRVSLVTRLIFQFLVRYDGAVGLPNILLGVRKRKDAVFPELLGPEVNPENLSDALAKLILDSAALSEKKKKGEELKTLLVPFAVSNDRTRETNSKIAQAIALKIRHGYIAKKVHGKKIQRKRRFIIAATSFLWSSVNFVRRKFYQFGLLQAHLVALPSVLVGNLQAGGAGKTPLVIAIAKEAVKRGYRVGVISRGYGRIHVNQNLFVDQTTLEGERNVQQIGDEPAEILEAVPEITLGLGKNRAQLAEALQKKGINFLVFDDGFQNLKFKAGKTILAVSDADPSQVLHRDFLSAGRYADLIVQTKGLPVRSKLPAFPIAWQVDALPTSPVWLLCGLADPSEVAQFYQNRGVVIERVLALPDHAKFNFEQVRQFQKEANDQGAVLAVTSKDWIKLKNDKTLTIFVLKRKISQEGWLDGLFPR